MEPFLKSYKMSYLLRTRFKKDIICEFLPANRKTARDVIIYASGMPGYPGAKKDVAEAFAKAGYWVFFPRYRGTWESGGVFLKDSPTKDIEDVIDVLTKAEACRLTDVYTQQTVTLRPRNIHVIGSSFGGPVALFCSQDKRVKNVVAISSVIDWRTQGPEEDVAETARFTKEGFGEAYRVATGGWKKLEKGKFYNPAHEDAVDFDGEKILMIHAHDDAICSYKDVEKFAKQTCAMLTTSKRGGHFGSSILLQPSLFKKVLTFLKS